ncbi:MAG: ABC transporter permease [Actinobacteria bacterium]|nr:ABC transporter permease [Actinomycetota bacterium]
MELMTTLAVAGRSSLSIGRRWVAPAAFLLLALIDIFFFAHYAHKGDATLAFSQPFAKVTVPNLALPGRATAYVMGGLSVVLAAARALELGKVARRASIGLVLFFFVIALLCWAYAGSSNTFNVINQFQGTLADSIPLILGALAGCLCERAGVINIAIEGQLLIGAFAGAIFASAFGTLWLGIIAGSAAGGLVSLLLGVFAIAYLVDQVILGVVLNVFVSGLTGYLYDKLLVPYANTLNSPSTYLPIKIPLLGDIPIIGPVFFDSTLFLYITYILVAAVQIGLFKTAWGLRVRAVGEHPQAADTVGISVKLTRYRNVILAGLIAGIGGAFLTIGSVGSFGKDMSSGRGYIALAAVIFGRWTPLGSVGAALLFGFAFELQSILSTINVPIGSYFLLMVPYVATIIAVAGLVGQVRAPAADGQPYVKA